LVTFEPNNDILFKLAKLTRSFADLCFREK
jgi:hypothetical protein